MLCVGACLDISQGVDEWRSAANSKHVNGPFPVEKGLTTKEPEYGNVGRENQKSAVENVMKVNDTPAHFGTHSAVVGSPVRDRRSIHTEQFARRANTKGGHDPLQQLVNIRKGSRIRRSLDLLVSDNPSHYGLSVTTSAPTYQRKAENANRFPARATTGD